MLEGTAYSQTLQAKVLKLVSGNAGYTPNVLKDVRHKRP